MNLSVICLLQLTASIHHTVTEQTDQTSTLADKVLSSPLNILLQPGNQADCKGNKVTFSVQAAGGSGQLHYTWKRKKPNETTFQTFGAADSSRLEIYNIGTGSESPGGTQYQATITDGLQTVLSAIAVLTVNEITGIAPTGVANYTVNEGDNLWFRVNTAGNNPSSYSWIKKFGTNDWRSLSDNSVLSGTQSSRLDLQKITPSDSGIYKVRVTFPTINGNECVETSTITRTIHVKTVVDTVPPVFILPTTSVIRICPSDPEEVCWDEVAAGTAADGGSFRLEAGKQQFDLPTAGFSDNITPSADLILYWTIYAGITTGMPVKDVNGQLLEDIPGQISAHKAIISFNAQQSASSFYRIVYRLKDKAGNVTPESGQYTMSIEIVPAPEIKSMF